MKSLRKSLVVFVLSCFILNTIFPSTVFAQSFSLPSPEAMISPTPSYTPVIMAGMTIHPQDPLQIDFIMDTGDDQLQGEDLREESQKLINYFLAVLTIPENNMWVNLSPYEKDRIVPDGLGQTILGRDMLAQDYILKKLTSSLLHPENEVGQRFWQMVHEKAYDALGTTDIPADTFNKIWIIPEHASIYIKGTNVLIADSHLKVMLEEDYVAMEHHDQGLDGRSEDSLREETKAILKDVLIPAIEKEVNEGKNFAPLRQIYHSMILATWYKTNLKQSLLGKVYVDQNKINGVDVANKDAADQIYDRYVEAFQKGAYDYIKEDYDPATQTTISQQYFSGGEDFAQ